MFKASLQKLIKDSLYAKYVPAFIQIPALGTIEEDTTKSIHESTLDDLAIEGWQGDTIRPRTWQDCRGIQPLLVVRILPCVMSSHTAKPIMMQLPPSMEVPERWINTTRSSSTASPLPDVCVSTGVRGSHRNFLTKQANLICAVLTACMVKK